jgi:hypothetical protein
MARLIFVAGTGRSGTHLLGRSVGSHRDIELRSEQPLTFRLVTYLATHQDWAGRGRMAIAERLLMAALGRIKRRSRKGFVLEKSHPSLWLAERILARFPDTLFLAVWRDAEPTVASMLRHGGVLSWYRKLPANAVNRFLGITRDNRETFAELPLEQKCALRWLSHKREIERLAAAFPKNVLSVRYDDFVIHREATLAKIADFLGVDNAFDPERIELKSLDKWKHELSDAQVAMIRSATAETRSAEAA